MYSQGNYGPPYGSPAPPHPSSYQQGPPAPYQQGLPVPPPYQQGPLTPSSAVLPRGTPAPTPIQHGLPLPIHVTPPGIMNMGQPYFNQPHSVHGSSPMAPSYQTPQQTPSYVPPVPSQNLHHTVPPVPLQPGAPLSGPCPPPPRVLPPPPSSTAQMMYRTLPPPPLHGNMQGPQPIRLLPPPPPAGFVPVTPAPYASFTHASVEDAHPPSMPPPPPPLPPSSPPPLPPSPPPPSSPPPNFATMASDMSSMIPPEPASDKPHHVESDFCSDKISDSMERTIDPVHKALVDAQLADAAPIPVLHTNGEDSRCHEMNSPIEDGASLKADALLDFPSPPPKPVEEDVVRNIEVLCQFIAKVGHDFENLARTKESGNPKFAFLFGGDPGSTAAIGHDYFLWMKRKCELEFKLQNESEHRKIYPESRPSEIESSLQSVSSADKDASVSPDLSDMDMEDDVCQPEKDQVMYQPAEYFCEDPVSVSNKGLVGKEQVHASQIQSSENLPLKDVVFETTHCSGSSQLVAEQREGDGQSSFSRLQTEDFSPVRSPPKGGNNEEVPRVFIKDGSPFRLIQDYASDDSAEDGKSACVEDVSPVRVSPEVTVGTSGLHEDEGMDACSNINSKNFSEIHTQPVTAYLMTEAVQHSDSSLAAHKVQLETVTHPDASGAIAKVDGPIAYKGENVMLSDREKAFENVALQGNDLNIDPPRNNVHKDEDAKQSSTILHVDEFGRLVREGISDSDSDEIHHSRRFGKRGRSPSPQESRWRRRSRSPRRRRDRRSRSRSWSPKKQRSRSKSPLASRRIGEFSSEKTRRDFRGQPPDCFDFLRGKCYRGASCRYLHHDPAPAPSDASRRSRNKNEQCRDVSPDVRNSAVHGDAHNIAETHDAVNEVMELGSDGHDILLEKGKSQDIQPRQDLSVNSTEAAKDDGLVEKTETDSLRDSGQPTTSSDIDQSLVSVSTGELGQSQGPQEAVAVVPETQEVQEVEKEHLIHHQEKQEPQVPMEVLNTQTSEISPAEPPPSNISCSISPPELKSDVPHPPNLDGSTSSSPAQTLSAANLNQTAPLSQLYPNQEPIPVPYPSQTPMSQPFPHQSSEPPLIPPKDFHPHNVPSGDFRFPPFQLPPPPYPPPNQYQLRPPVANFQSHPSAAEGFPYQPHIVDYHSQRTPTAKPTWTNLPPPPPLPPSFSNGSALRPVNSPVDFHPSQFQQNLMPVRDDNLSQPSTRNPLSEELTYSRVLSFQHQTFPHMADPLLSSQMKDYRSGPLEVEHRWDQPFQGPSYLRGERFTSPVPKSSEFISKPLPDYHLHPPLQEGGRAFDTEIMQSRPPAFPREPTSIQGHSFPGDSLPLRPFSREDFSSPANNSSYSQRQQSSYDSQLPVTGSFPSHLGMPSNVDSSFSRYPSGLSDMGSKVSSSTHYNPFASTFEQTPSGSKFVSSVLRRESGSNYSRKLGGELVTGDQYDPLFDSIEPSSNLLRKFDHVGEQDSIVQVVSRTSAMWAVNDRVPEFRPSGSHVPLDVEENNKQKEGVVAIVKRPENDDFDGAATDAEIGVVENGSPRPGEGKNWSPGLPNDLVNTGVGEIEIDQVQTSGKSKKSKDSRSMKLFKIAIADFVKEVLKPSWRQGNMSKEAFKTIVKKTVDKVSGAMQSHQIPKSQAKISQYVESSQRKLTKLVMGYVDKYVKV